MRFAFCAVALLAAILLLPRAMRVGFAGDFVDPVGRITAQDEALYGHSAIEMAEHGDWMSPHFLGRLALYKPPMLAWLAGASGRVFGVGRISLRLPVLIVAALAVGLVFLWGAEAAGPMAGICAALLVFGNRIFHTLSTLCMTDGLVVAFTVAAVYCIYSDPWLESRRAVWGFAASSAAAILTKGIAGLFPVAVLGLYFLCVRPKERPSLVRAARAVALAGLLAAPWFVYQAVAHPKWFWTEHVAVEILGYGAGAPPQTSREGAVLFYLLRLAATDPVLLAAAVVAIPAFARLLRERRAGPVLLTCWVALATAAALGWQYRNASYLLPAVPALALIAACYGTFAERRHATWMLAFLCLGIAVKAAVAEAPWSLNYRGGTVQPLAAALSGYCEERRGQRLGIFGVADDLYAAVLPMPDPRYLLIAAPAAAGRYGMPFEEMGITVTARQFGELAALLPAFRESLRKWGVESDRPVATLVRAESAGELEGLIRDHPEMDFLVPDAYRAAGDGHLERRAAPGYVFLLSRTGGTSYEPAWTCRM